MPTDCPPNTSMLSFVPSDTSGHVVPLALSSTVIPMVSELAGVEPIDVGDRLRVRHERGQAVGHPEEAE
jgi:hypothetical protein